MLIYKRGLVFAWVLFALGFLSVARADFVAFSVTTEGERLPLPQDVDSIDVEYLVNVEWGQYSGNKTRIGVLQVENNSRASSVNVMGPGGAVTYNASSGGVPVQGIEAILTDVMHRTGRFRMVERKVLDQTLREQDLGASGRIAKPSAAKVGQVLGAEYLFQAVVTNYEAGVEEKGGGLGGLIGGSAGALLGGLSMKSSKAIIGMNFRLINAETSEIIYTDQVQVDLSSSGLNFGGLGFTGGVGLGGFLSDYSKTPIGHAVIAAVNKGVFDLVRQVGSQAPSGSVVQVKNGNVYLNLGDGAVAVGDMLTLMERGEKLIDPDTGIALGGEDEPIGELKVTSVKEKYSLAKPVGIKLSKIKRGNKVVSQRQSDPLKYASSFAPPKKSGGFFSGGGNNTNSGSNSWGTGPQN
ncbi:CsgG/HfaB family protein [Sedimenticola sp.]|uniref:CsgG/HfaB family protein n=1 Tax=Sedimenticola sp. TaxID=1940285 RepID=UPI002589F7F9|nr:CsgG/HfaB family protein [Sedimenticola sp.]MCW8903342.1 CsgG/HfaB family protein [Sedimenticola sp.]